MKKISYIHFNNSVKASIVNVFCDNEFAFPFKRESVAMSDSYLLRSNNVLCCTYCNELISGYVCAKSYNSRLFFRCFTSIDFLVNYWFLNFNYSGVFTKSENKLKPKSTQPFKILNHFYSKKILLLTKTKTISYETKSDKKGSFGPSDFSLGIIFSSNKRSV